MNADFFKSHGTLFLCAILIAVVFFSLIRLTSWPNVWFDEGLDIEIAHNFLLFGKLDISTAPNVFSGLPYVVGTNGYSLTIPLAGIFYVFGFGLMQARIFMLFWLVAALVSIYFIVKSVFGADKALLSVALTATFSSFYCYGLTVFGEVPGFVFLIWGLFFLARLNKPNLFLTGLFFALAAVTKPSLYLLLFPSFLLFLLIKERKGFFKKIFNFTIGVIPPLILWIVLAFPNPISLNTWKGVLLFYRYPFGADFSIAENVIKNIRLVFTHSTLIYFLLITMVIIFWHLKGNKTDFIKRKWGAFFFVYAAFAFLYFLKSPGWLRYLLGFELMVFIVFPSALEILSQKIFKKERVKKLVFTLTVFFFLAIQFFQLFYFRSDFYSPYPADAASFVNENLAKNDNYKAGFLNLPEVAGLVHPLKKFHITKVGGPFPAFGKNPLSFAKKSLPQFIVLEGESIYAENYKNILEANYFLLEEIGKYHIYEFK